MKFEEFWNSLTKELVTEKTFHTLKQSKPFEAHYYSGIIFVKPSSGKIWTIRKEHMKEVWNIALHIPESKRFRPTHYGKGNIRTSSYIVTLMKYILKNEKLE